MKGKMLMFSKVSLPSFINDVIDCNWTGTYNHIVHKQVCNQFD